MLMWIEFNKLWHNHFEPQNWDRKLRELAKLWQTHSVNEYMCKFKQWLSCVGPLLVKIGQLQVIAALTDRYEGTLHEGSCYCSMRAPTNRNHRAPKSWQHNKNPRNPPPPSTTNHPMLNQCRDGQWCVRGLRFNFDKLFSLGRKCKRLFMLNIVAQKKVSKEPWILTNK